MKRLVVFASRTLNELRRRALRLDELSAAGLPVEYWDLNPLYHRYPSEPSEVSRPYVRRFEVWCAVDEALAAAEMAETVIVPTFGYDPGFYGTFRRLSRSRARLAVPRLIGSPTIPESFVSSLKLRLTSIGMLRITLVKRAMLAARRLGLIRGFDLAITVGETAKAASAGLPRIPIHHCDYDDWCAMREQDRSPVPRRFAVFLDTFYSGHPDHVHEGLSPVDAAHYFKTLNAFFARLERRHGLEIVIAAHPKAEYSVNPFEGRKIFFSATRVLARFSEFAVTTFSASMSYVIFGGKPLFIIDSDEMAVVHRPSGQEAMPRMFADVLRARYVNLDHPAPEDELVAPVDPAIYEDYKYRYLVSRENEGRSTFEILGRYLRGEEQTV